jgi:hypothetical protein
MENKGLNLGTNSDMIRLDGNREDFGDNTREEIVCDG